MDITTSNLEIAENILYKLTFNEDNLFETYGGVAMMLILMLKGLV